MKRALAASLLLVSPAYADDARVERFDDYIRTVGPLCAVAASTRCAETAFALADRDGDGRLELTDLREIREDLGMWLQARGQQLAPMEANYVGLGLWITDAVGLERLFVSYDVNRDGALDFAEVTADVTLDERPLGDVVLDTSAVDWVSLRSRLGALAAALPAPP